MKYEFMPATAK